MTTTVRPTETTRAPMDSTRKTALVAGTLYLVTFITSIPALFLYSPVLHHADFIISSGSDTRVFWGALLEVVCALAGIGSAVALFPVVKRQHEGFALGFVTSRVVEAGIIITGVISLLSVVTLRQDVGGATGADKASLVIAGKSLVAIHDWTFLLGPGVMAGVNALLLGTLMYRSGLVPRLIPLMGLVGAPLLLASDIAVLFGAYDQTSKVAGFATAPIFMWELSLGVWMAVKGFKPSPITAQTVAPSTPPAYAEVTG